MNLGDLVLEGYEEGPIVGIERGDLVVQGYLEGYIQGKKLVDLVEVHTKEVKRRYKHGCPRP